MSAAVIQSAPAMFWTKAYGAFRWHSHLYADKAPWYLVTFNSEFDRMRGVDQVNIPCTVDNFGNLVRVPA